MNVKLKNSLFISWRFYFSIGFILLIIFALLLRIIYLVTFERSFLLSQGQARSIRVVNEPSLRGMITDRNGYPLAVSARVYSLFINPQTFPVNYQDIFKIAYSLKKNPAALLEQIIKNKNKKKEFMYLSRGLSPYHAKKLHAEIGALYLKPQFKRFYPEGEATASLLGFTNVDDKGQEGVEFAFDDWLRGNTGKEIVLKNRKGEIISNIKMLSKEASGKSLILSINHLIQYLAYSALKSSVKENKANTGTAIVLDVQTGEILALVNFPSFNPNHLLAKEKNYFRNRAVTDTFEPGSTIKTFSILTALLSHHFKPDTIIDTSPGFLRVGKHLVQDEHNNGKLTLTEILQYSSNVGATKVMLTLPPENMYALLTNFGFGKPTGINLPGEQIGTITKQTPKNPFGIATLSFGYGLSVNALQLAHAYATLANHGKLIPLSLYPVQTVPHGTQLIDAKIADEMLLVLESVLNKGGTGVSAKIPGFHIAGKTGTAKIARLHGYEKHHYISSFVGVAPVSNPRLVVAVVIHDPKGKAYLGGPVAGPVFKKIMEGSLNILNIPPDDAKNLVTTS